MISPHDQPYSMGSETMTISFKGAHFPPDIILMGVRVVYPTAADNYFIPKTR